MSSKRFVIVSFFVTLTLSALCQSAYDIVKALYPHISMEGCANLMYVVGLACFIIKYFIDDVVDDNGGAGENPSRRSLASLIVAWMFFLFAAVSAGSISTSALFWLIGIGVVTWFLFHNRFTISVQCFRRYLWENIGLCIPLLILATAFPKNPARTTCLLVGVTILFVVTVGAFTSMLRDDGRPTLSD